MKRYLYGIELYENIQRVAFNKNMNLTVGRLCDSAGISRTTMSNLRNDKSTSLNDNTLMKLAKYLGIDVKELYTVEVPEETKNIPIELQHPEFIKLTGKFMPDQALAALANAKLFYLRKNTICMVTDNPYQPDTAIVYTATDQLLVEGTAEEILKLL